MSQPADGFSNTDAPGSGAIVLLSERPAFICQPELYKVNLLNNVVSL